MTGASCSPLNSQVKTLNRDLAAAEIDKTDDRGRTIDVHAMRHTFGSMLSVAGVAPRVAQSAMRHSTIDLTMNVYTDPRLLDLQGAIDQLPTLTFAGPVEHRATGTDDSTVATRFATSVATATGYPGELESLSVHLGSLGKIAAKSEDCGKALKTKGFRPIQRVETKGLEPSTPGLQSRCSPN